jgi:tetratricopeptide (TPR) repeat protein
MFQPDDQVFTQYGQGRVISTRSSTDGGMVEVEIIWGETSKCKAFLRPQDIQIRKKLFEMSNEEKIERALVHRKEGNMMFKLDAFEHAIKKYELARIYLRQLDRPLTLVEIEETLIPLLNNVALAHLSLNNVTEVIDTCNEIEKTYLSAAPTPSSNNNHTTTVDIPLIKTLYLRAQAYCKKQDYDIALLDLKRAIMASPNNKPVRDLLEKVIVEIRKGKEKAREMFGGAFSSTQKTTTTTTTSSNDTTPPTNGKSTINGKKNTSIPTKVTDSKIVLKPFDGKDTSVTTTNGQTSSTTTSILNNHPNTLPTNNKKPAEDLSPYSAIAVLAFVGALSAFFAYSFMSQQGPKQQLQHR